ncbi:MAG: cellulose biosynthesis cyclic di-GMP-binding regulatory protein BcsB [Gallionella sp.]
MSASVYAKRHHHVVKPVAVVEPVLDTDKYSHYTYTLKQLGVGTPFELHSVDGRRTLSFSVRSDEVITAADLKLIYAWSPALIPELSHLKVILNDELMKSLPLPLAKSNGEQSDIRLNPAMFVDFNKLTLNLIAHYTRDCEDPMHSTLWANISNKSEVDFTIRHLKLANDLALLPAPFFDELDNSKLVLPIVFPEKPNNSVLHAAGVLASWFGALADYRGAKFPVLLNTLPKGDGVVMVAGGAPPAGLGLQQITGPSLAIVSNPLNSYAKLLVVMGRDAKELEIAVQALTLGKITLTGRYVNVLKMKAIPERKPYDAPNWIPTDRAVHFGEMAMQSELQKSGIVQAPIKINFNIPPDIFPWRSEGVPVDLHYRYTPRPVPDRSTLNVSMNDRYVESFPLISVPSKLDKKFELPLLEDGKAIRDDVVLIPHADLQGSNQMQFQYFFDYTKQGTCKDVFLNNELGVIDPNSTIDFSSFPHYTALPNLGFFTHSGFPYTRMADLSETAVVMPDNADNTEMATYLMLMGRMGKITGYPAIRHALISAAQVNASADKDLILIGTAGDQPLLKRWSANMHPLLEAGSHALSLHGPFERFMSRWESRDLPDAMKRAGNLVSKGDGGLGALVAFESPLKSGRSVVAMTGDDSKQIDDIVNAMFDDAKRPYFKGDLVLQSGKHIDGFQMGPSYYVGHLPWFTALRWYLSKQPLILIILIGLAALLVAVISFRFLRNLATRRLAKS